MVGNNANMSICALVPRQYHRLGLYKHLLNKVYHSLRFSDWIVFLTLVLCSSHFDLERVFLKLLVNVIALDPLRGP